MRRQRQMLCLKTALSPGVMERPGCHWMNLREPGSPPPRMSVQNGHSEGSSAGEAKAAAGSGALPPPPPADSSSAVGTLHSTQSTSTAPHIKPSASPPALPHGPSWSAEVIAEAPHPSTDQQSINNSNTTSTNCSNCDSSSRAGDGQEVSNDGHTSKPEWQGDGLTKVPLHPPTAASNASRAYPSSSRSDEAIDDIRDPPTMDGPDSATVFHVSHQCGTVMASATPSDAANPTHHIQNSAQPQPADQSSKAKRALKRGRSVMYRLVRVRWAGGAASTAGRRRRRNLAPLWLGRLLL